MLERKEIIVEFEGHSYAFPRGISYGKMIEELPIADPSRVLLVEVEGRLRELHKLCNSSCRIEPVLISSPAGFDTYRRSVNFLFLKAVYDVTNKDPDVRVMLQFSIRNGYYYEIWSNSEDRILTCSPDMPVRIKERMLELVEERIPIRKQTVSTHKAIHYFREKGMQDKARLFRFRRSSTMNIYSMEDYYDYFYGYMVQHTGYLKLFDVIAYREGLILVLPKREETEVLLPFQASPKLFDTQKKAEQRGMELGISSVGGLNECICEQGINHQILMDESFQEGKVSEIADEIIRRKEVKVVLIAGPSSSGKTTFSRRLCIQLAAKGLKPHPLSLDNYYKNRSDCPVDEDGNYDFERLEALDLELLHKDLDAMMAGEEIELPRFSFIRGIREYHGDRIRLQKDDILVVEGIHALNDRIGDFLSSGSRYRIYISALTQMNLDDHNPISTTDARLIRRIVRDFRARETSAAETIAMWPSVRRGEQKYIFRFQENADVIFNSALNYELSILKIYAEPILFQVPEGSAEQIEAKRLLKFLDYFLAMPSDMVPQNSILREFIGGSCFDV